MRSATQQAYNNVSFLYTNKYQKEKVKKKFSLCLKNKISRNRPSQGGERPMHLEQ